MPILDVFFSGNSACVFFIALTVIIGLYRFLPSSVFNEQLFWLFNEIRCKKCAQSTRLLFYQMNKISFIWVFSPFESLVIFSLFISILFLHYKFLNKPKLGYRVDANKRTFLQYNYKEFISSTNVYYYKKLENDSLGIFACYLTDFLEDYEACETWQEFYCQEVNNMEKYVFSFLFVRLVSNIPLVEDSNLPAIIKNLSPAQLLNIRGLYLDLEEGWLLIIYLFFCWHNAENFSNGQDTLAIFNRWVLINKKELNFFVYEALSSN